MAVKMNNIYCPHAEDCKYKEGCIVVNNVEDGARFSPSLKLKLESLTWKVKCFSYVEKRR